MIEQVQSKWSSLPDISLGQAAPGDTFVVIQFNNHGDRREVLRYTVVRVLKRDVVCRDAHGREKRFNIGRVVSYAFRSDDDPGLLKIVESERRRRLMAKAAGIAERAASRGGAHIDDELADALFAYAKRRAVAGSDTGSRPTALLDGDLQEIDASKALEPTEAAKALRGLKDVFATIPALEKTAAKSSPQRVVLPKVAKAEKQRPLKLWNGRGYCCKKTDDPRWEKIRHNAIPHAYVAAYSRADAARVIAGYTGRTPPDSELREYWSPFWGTAMQGIKPVRGLWLQFDHTQKPVRVTK